jgi:putative ATP-dependent endonuclease of the OLD family
LQFFDSDFHNRDTDNAIEIEVTVGDLPESMLVLDRYALFARGFDATNGLIDDEPEATKETVLTLKLKVASCCVTG